MLKRSMNEAIVILSLRRRNFNLEWPSEMQKSGDVWRVVCEGLRERPRLSDKNK